MNKFKYVWIVLILCGIQNVISTDMNNAQSKLDSKSKKVKKPKQEIACKNFVEISENVNNNWSMRKKAVREFFLSRTSVEQENVLEKYGITREKPYQWKSDIKKRFGKSENDELSGIDPQLLKVRKREKNKGKANPEESYKDFVKEREEFPNLHLTTLTEKLKISFKDIKKFQKRYIAEQNAPQVSMNREELQVKIKL